MREAEEGGSSAAEALLREVTARCRERFEERRQILSFPEYLAQVLEDPRPHVRSAPVYLRDLFDFYGTEQVRTPRGVKRRFRLFDAPFDEAVDRTRLRGQEGMQNEVYRHLETFCEKGVVDKLIMIHGPNGTAKSTFVECVAAGLEDYSQRPEGVLYTFNWVFSEAADRAALGFHEPPERREDGSLAYLEPEEITFKVTNELKDHPLLLVPQEERRGVLERAFGGELPGDLPDAITRGDLSAKSQAVFQALNNAYQGDWWRVCRHVQVERLYFSQRYRRGVVVIQPQRNVDASSRPLNLERSYRLPPVLSQSSLSELSGELIDANRGIVEYSDFFKRPLELSKYLLTTSEKGTISLPDSTAYLDCVFLATCNEKNLSLFKRNPDFPSFKGRFELVRAPYLLSWGEEQKIYDRRIHAVAQHKSVAPHTTRIVALWAVLTRLRRPRAMLYPGTLADLVDRLQPMDKARLYDTGQAPEEWTDQARRELQSHLEDVAGEYDTHEEEFEGLIDAGYEGRRGASPREVMMILHEAAQDPELPALSPPAVFKVIRRVTADRSLYEFLRQDADRGYGDVEALTEVAEAEYLRLVRDEVHRALALVEEEAYELLFEDYFRHVKAFDAGEKVRNRLTQALESPSTDLMQRVEDLVDLGGDTPEAFRKGLILRIAAWAIDHPSQPVAYREIFGDIFQKIRASYHRERERAIQQLQTQLLRYGTDEWDTVEPAQQARVVEAMQRLESYGYDAVTAREALTYVLRHADGED